MKLDIHHYHHHDESGPVVAGLFVILMELKMISQEVQAILDRAKRNTSLVQSVDLGMKALSVQVTDLQAKINALPVGNKLSDEDKAALSEAASSLDTAITTLQADIPANTQGSDGSAGNADPNGPNAAAAATLDANSQSGALGSGDGTAGDKPLPLPGTGQS